MRQQEFEEKLEKVADGTLERQEPMKNHTTFRIGGPADYLISPKSVEQIQEVISLCRIYSVACRVIGNGSNLLVSDQGIDGVVLKLGKAFSQVKQEGVCLLAQAGIALSALARKAAQVGLSGLEFASGIPGTLGGAIVMNAGAYGGEMAQVVRRVALLSEKGERIDLTKEEMQFGYRTSIVSKMSYTVLEAELCLKEGEQAVIEADMAELNAKRKEKQPLEYPSAGSTFRRPVGYFAGKLIMEAGLSGFRIGDAQVSKKHCGFVINRGNATAKEVIDLMEQVQQIVYKKTGVKLEPEVRYLGREGADR